MKKILKIFLLALFSIIFIFTAFLIFGFVSTGFALIFISIYLLTLIYYLKSSFSKKWFLALLIETIIILFVSFVPLPKCDHELLSNKRLVADVTCECLGIKRMNLGLFAGTSCLGVRKNCYSKDKYNTDPKEEISCKE